MQHVYEVSMEVKATDRVDEFPEGYVGAYVNTYVASGSIREALSAAEEDLGSLGFEVVDIDHAWRMDLDAYEPEDENYPTRGELRDVLASSQPCCGPFFCFTEEER